MVEATTPPNRSLLNPKVYGLNVIIDLFCFLFSTGISEYQSIEGDSVSLPCNISTGKWNEVHISLVVWYRSGNQGNPIYSIDARNSLTSSRHQITAELDGRARMDFTVQPPVLHIDSVKAEDFGDYRCRVDYFKNRTQQFLIHLNVSGKLQMAPHTTPNRTNTPILMRLGCCC